MVAKSDMKSLAFVHAGYLANQWQLELRSQLSFADYKARPCHISGVFCLNLVTTSADNQ